MGNKIELGYRVKHKIHGFTGIITGITRYLTGCDHVMVRPEKLDKDDKPIEAHWFDANMIDVVSDEQVVIVDNGSNDTGGPQDNPPTGAI